MSSGIASVPWHGFWTYFDVPVRHAMQLNGFRNRDGFEASGRDEVGDFRCTGTPGAALDSWELVKQYTGKHQVRYEAALVGEGFAGRWFLNGHCGGSFLLWPGTSDSPPGGLLEAMPKVELLPFAQRRPLQILGWGLLLAGQIGLSLAVWWLPTKSSAAVAILVYALYTMFSEKLHNGMLRRQLQKAVGPLLTLPARPPSDLKQPVTPATLIVAALMVLTLLWATWECLQKPR
jgi:hypothetical protein